MGYKVGFEFRGCHRLYRGSQGIKGFRGVLPGSFTPFLSEVSSFSILFNEIGFIEGFQEHDKFHKI